MENSSNYAKKRRGEKKHAMIKRAKQQQQQKNVQAAKSRGKGERRKEKFATSFCFSLSLSLSPKNKPVCGVSSSFSAITFLAAAVVTVFSCRHCCFAPGMRVNILHKQSRLADAKLERETRKWVRLTSLSSRATDVYLCVSYFLNFFIYYGFSVLACGNSITLCASSSKLLE